MKVGLLHETPYAEMKDYHDFPAPNKMFDPQEGHRLYLEYIDELVLAEELGFDYIALPEQHSKQDNIDPSPNVIISHLVGKTKKIGLLPYGAILPLHNPIRIAEEYAMLDVLSKGRLLAGFVHGGLTNYLAYGMDYLSERDKFEEAWDLIVKAWTTDEPFQWRGKHYQFENVSVWPRPYQKPHPPIFTAGGASASAAAEKGGSFGSGFTTTTEETRGLFGRYRDIYAKKHGRAPPAANLAVARSIYVAETESKAKAESERPLLHQYRVLYRPSMVANERIAEKAKVSLYWASRLFLANEGYDAIVKRGNHIAGSPETVAEMILEQRKDLRFGALLGLFRFGDMTHDQAARSMRLFAEEVMPRLRRAN